ncbi:AbrB/MazE/SpoVT family DNA-binding domain-containing protein [Candidatus Woesearchaeota archaeon]|nr:AbrB/MazE/SpoVT family DNA-binding domain-containing protein [Candidatus Woesearchaeota archaeon]
MTRLQFDERQYKLTLPKKLLEAIGWKKGDEIAIEILDGRIVLINSSENEVSKGRIEYAR